MGTWICGSTLVCQYRGGESICAGPVEIAEIVGKVGAFWTGGKNDGDSDGVAPFIGGLFQMAGENCKSVTDAIGWSGDDGRRCPGRATRLCGGHARAECRTLKCDGRICA